MTLLFIKSIIFTEVLNKRPRVFVLYLRLDLGIVVNQSSYLAFAVGADPGLRLMLLIRLFTFDISRARSLIFIFKETLFYF